MRRRDDGRSELDGRSTNPVRCRRRSARRLRRARSGRWRATRRWLSGSAPAILRARAASIRSRARRCTGSREQRRLRLCRAQPAGGGTLPNLHYIPNGAAVQAQGSSSQGLAGRSRPRGMKNRRPSLRRLSTRDDRRRHFVHERSECVHGLCRQSMSSSHMKRRGPFRSAACKDAGKTPINEVLSAINPRLHLFGHHHLYRSLNGSA